jgi:hypothetical protein
LVLGGIYAVAYWELGKVRQFPFRRVSTTKEHV